MTHLCYHCNKNDKCFYTTYIINNIKINEFDKIFNNYITTHNKKFDFYYIDCEFEILFENNYTANIEIDCHYNTDLYQYKELFIILY